MAALIAEKGSGNDRKFSPLMEIESMHVRYSSSAYVQWLRLARDEHFCVFGFAYNIRRHARHHDGFIHG